MLPSPCVRNCCLDRDNICLGCYRHVDEICRWAEADEETQKNILRRAAKRRRDREQRHAK